MLLPTGHAMFPYMWDLRERVKENFTHFKPDVPGPVHHNKNLIEMTNKMQLCRIIYYSIVP